MQKNEPVSAKSAHAPTPSSLSIEHEELHAMLRRATSEPGSLGDAAKAVARLMHPHFVKEEEFALPPLGLLPALLRGETIADARAVLAMTDRLKSEMAEMLTEHRQIVKALTTMKEAAERANKPAYADFARKLMLHAQMEEEVMYPAAILVGEYLRSKHAEDS